MSAVIFQPSGANGSVSTMAEGWRTLFARGHLRSVADPLGRDVQRSPSFSPGIAATACPLTKQEVDALRDGLEKFTTIAVALKLPR